MQRAFVTGGSGFVGRALIAELVGRKVAVHALARSSAAAQAVEKVGAKPVFGDLDDARAMAAGMEGCDVVFHSAAYLLDGGPAEMFDRVNVVGTENTLGAARAAGVKRFLHVSTEAVLANGRPIVKADESVPRARRPVGNYSRTKALAEERVLASNVGALETVIIRPRFIWGKGDTSLLPQFIAAVKSGGFAWMDGGHYLTSTCHVDNVVEGALLAAEKGKAGAVYFLTDGEPVEFRSFITQLLKTRGVDAGKQEIPRLAALITANVAEAVHAVMEDFPVPVTRQALALMSHEVTVVDARARAELGYKARKTMEAGLKELG